MSLTTWIDDRIKVAVAAALTPENLKTISDAVVAAVATQINAEGDRIVDSIVGHVSESAATVINELASKVDQTGQSLAGDINGVTSTVSSDVNSIAGIITANTNGIVQQVIKGIQGILPFPL